MIEEVYEPREDSFLFIELLEKYLKNQKTILDMGTGSGVLAIFVKKKLPDSIVIGADINPKAIETARKNADGLNIEFIQSDLFENIKRKQFPNCTWSGHEKFDLIIFNPPYLPTNDSISGKEQWQEGNVIKRFLINAFNYLNKNGKILILKSSLTKTNIRGKVLMKKKIPWEELQILEIR